MLVARTDTEAAPAPPAATFPRELTVEVEQVLTPEVLNTARRRLQRKALVVTTWYVGSYAAVLLAPSIAIGIVACVSLALSIAAVGFNIQHDASHNALFATSGRRRLSAANRAAGFALNAIGGDATRWLTGHVKRHHSAPNVAGRDDDIDLGVLARLAPSQVHRPWHRYQHLYMWPLYTASSAAIFVSDMTATIGESLNSDRSDRPSVRTYIGLLGSKTLFAAVLLGVPLLVHTGWSVLLGGLLVTALAGLLFGVVFQLAHAVEEAEFRALDAPTDGRWHQWQIEATVGFAHGSGPAQRLVTWFLGGLNHQVEHHLFPSVPHTAYPEIAPVVASVCARHGLTYRLQATLRGALRSHHRHLRTMGRPN